MGQLKIKYSGKKQVCFCDAANDKNLLFSKADLRLDRREKFVDDGPWVRAWLASCPDLAIVSDEPAKHEPVKTPAVEERRPEPRPEHQYKPMRPKQGKVK